MQLVDEKNDVTALFDLVKCGFYALLKVASVFGAGHHAGKVEGDHPLVFENFRHLAVGDFKGKTLGNCRFTDAGLADKAGVVFGAAGENLYNTLNFLASADDGVDFAGLCLGGEVSAEFVKGGAFPVRLFACGRALSRARKAFRGRKNFGGKLLGVYAELFKECDGIALSLFDNGEQYVLGAHISSRNRAGGGNGHFENSFGAGCEVVGGKTCGKSLSDLFGKQLGNLLLGYSLGGQKGCGRAGALGKNTEQQVLAADVGVTHGFGLFYCKV